MTDQQSTESKLPEICAARDLTGRPVFIRRGQKGYLDAHPDTDPDVWNAREGITPAMVEAMTFGSLFGFDKPGADPATYQYRMAACQNCEWRGPITDLQAIKDFDQRVAAGEPCPAGQCPKCGSLASQED